MPGTQGLQCLQKGCRVCEHLRLLHFKMKTCSTPVLYSEGDTIFHKLDPKLRLWILRGTTSARQFSILNMMNVLSKNKQNIKNFQLKCFIFKAERISV